MKKMNLKRVAALAVIAGCLFGAVPCLTYACIYKEDCFAVSYNVVCGRVYGSEYGHQVTDENGYTTWCTVSVGSSLHTIECAGCGTVAHSETETRVCFEQHSHKYCQDKNYCCQYGWAPSE